MAIVFEDIAEKFASQKRSVGENEMPHTRMRNHSSQWIRTACIMLYKQPWCQTTIIVLCYLAIRIQMAEISASGLGGDTESEYRSFGQVFVLDLGNLPLNHQALIAVCRRIISFVPYHLSVPHAKLIALYAQASLPLPPQKTPRPHRCGDDWWTTLVWAFFFRQGHMSADHMSAFVLRWSALRSLVCTQLQVVTHVLQKGGT